MGRKKKKETLSSEQWELVTHGGKCQLCGKELKFPNLACTYDAAKSRWTCASHPYMVLNEKEHRWDMIDMELFQKMDGPRQKADPQGAADAGEEASQSTGTAAGDDSGPTAAISGEGAHSPPAEQELTAAAPAEGSTEGADASGSADADAVAERARLRGEARRLRDMVATRDETIAQLESKLEDASYRALEVQAQARNAGSLLQDATKRAEAAETENARLRDALAKAEDRARRAEATSTAARGAADKDRAQLAAAAEAAAEARAALEQDVTKARGEAHSLTQQLRRISRDMEARERTLREQLGRTEAAERVCLSQADALSRAASEREAEAEATAGWAAVPVYGADGPPTHTHGLDSPVLQHLLATWGQEKGEDKRRALARWLDHVVHGHAVDGHGFVRGLELGGLAPEVSEGVVLLLLPLLRRRTDLHLGVQSRERTVRDLRIRLDPIARPVAERVAESHSTRRRHASTGSRSPAATPSSLNARRLHASAVRRAGRSHSRAVPVPRPTSAHAAPGSPYSPPSLEVAASWSPTAVARSALRGARPSPMADRDSAGGGSFHGDGPAGHDRPADASPGPGDIPGPDDLAVWLHGEAASAEGVPPMAGSAPSDHFFAARSQGAGEEQFIRRVRERAAQRTARGSRRRQIALRDE